MRTELFLPPLLISFAFSAGFMLLLLLIPLFRKALWREGKRHVKKNVSRLGGLAILFSFVLTAFLDPHLVFTPQIWGLIAGTGFIFLFGLWDDIAELDWQTQVFCQVCLAFIIFLCGVRIATVTNPFGGVFVFPEAGFILPGFLLILGWLLLVMNAVNWLDGLDGLCGGVSFITFLTIFFLALKPEVNQPALALLALVGAGATGGFLLFNIHPAKILAGTVGSLFLGFLIAVLAVMAGTKIATALLVLSLPIADAFFVIIERLRAGVSIFQADQRHLHYKLRELGWSESRIAWFFFSITAVIALVALFTQALGKFVAMVLVLGIIFLLLFYVSRKTRRKEA